MAKINLSVKLWDGVTQEEIDQLLELFKNTMSVKVAEGKIVMVIFAGPVELSKIKNE